MTTSTQELLIERWLPIEEMGIESRRENSTGQHPPINRLHIWFARRPLTASRAAVLASLLPNWEVTWPPHLLSRFPTEESYHRWFQALLGIRGDVVQASKLLRWARQHGERVANPFTNPRAFTISPSEDDIVLVQDLIELRWGTREPTVLDSFAGGGSIPFESLRFGFTTYANELNPVASTILAASLDYPARFGVELSDDIQRWGTELSRRVRTQLEPFFAKSERETPLFYLWARTVACPSTGKPVPLSPNWWLQKGADPIAVKVLCDPNWAECHFEIVRGKEVARAYPDDGTIRRGVAVSPWTGDTVDGDYIKREAQAGRMGQQLFAVGALTPRGREFRLPTEQDLATYAAAEAEYARRLPEWESRGLVPYEPRKAGRADWSSEIYGLKTWAHSFSHRQLLALITCVITLQEIERDVERESDHTRAQAIRTYLGFVVDKMADYNSQMTRL
ncbi:MAG: DUF1156 domain-containing protein, partial [Chloroflexales bacterium]|nr:DUF1156 domain-containing protein [Chloroflexales bacterium]